VIVVHLNLSLAHADTTDDFMQILRTTHVKAIDVALIRLELFIDQENKKLKVKNTELKFIQTNNRIELNTFIKKSNSEMTITQCRNALKNLKKSYKHKALVKIALPNYSSENQKIAEKIFNHQVLLVDKIESDVVITCN
jgi:DNA primase catalytic subunit